LAIPFQRHQKIRQTIQRGITTTSSSSLKVLQGKPFWIWDRAQHYKLAGQSLSLATDGKGAGHTNSLSPTCCFNHIVGLPQKDGVEFPIFDYEWLLYDSLMTADGSFKDKHLWVKKSIGLGVTEFMLRIMAWLCTSGDPFHNAQACIVTGPNIDIAIGLIKRMKQIFESKLQIIFQNKETVRELHGCRIEADPSNHIYSFRALENPKFILIDEGDFFRKGEQEVVRHVSERYIGKSDPLSPTILAVCLNV
jgi:hypothetical protein